MRHRPYKFITFFLALIFAFSSWIPLPLLADVQMRCAGAPPQAAPCAHAQLPAAGLTEKQVYGTLMACCRSMRSMQGGCAQVQNCPMRRSSPRFAAQRQSPSPRECHSARRCLVTIRISRACRYNAAYSARAPISDHFSRVCALSDRPYCAAFAFNRLRSLLGIHARSLPTRRTRPARPSCASLCLNPSPCTHA